MNKIWKSKLFIKENFRNKIEKKNDKETEKLIFLRENLNDFNINKVFISSFLKNLWNCPEAMYHIINNTKLEDVKSNLAPFITDRFYNNYLSGNYMENSLLFVITLMLADEISKISNIKDVDKFLDNTRCGYLLEELINLPDIQIFFKKIIINTIEKMETTCSYRKLNLNIQKMEELIKLNEDNKSKKNKNSKTDEEALIERILKESKNNLRADNKIMKERNLLFSSKYIPNINSQELNKLSEKAMTEKKFYLFSYFDKLNNDIQLLNNKELYSNLELMTKMGISKHPTIILSLYQYDFLEIIPFIEQLMSDINENIILLPNSVKYICKIISILIKKKFKDISQMEENEFISRFIIEKLLIPILSKPNYKGPINEFIISGNTFENLKLITLILKKLFTGKLFINDKKEGEYTPFNWMIFDQIENIFSFYKKITNVNLPEFIDKYINNNFPEDYVYDYFNENKGEFYANISICFNVDILLLLIDGLSKSNFFMKNNPIITSIKNSIERFSEKTINDIQKCNLKVVSEIKEKLPKQNNDKNNEKFEVFYIFNSEQIEENSEEFFSHDNKVGNFFIDINKLEEGKKLDEAEKYIIQIKNYLCNSLGNYRLLNKTDFILGENSDTKGILNEVLYYMTLPNFIINNNTVPSKWYINCILDYLDKIPEEYKKNDYNKLFLELMQNIKDAINDLNFEKLILFMNKFKFIEKMNDYYEKIYDVMKDIYIKDKVKYIVENFYIPVELNFKYSNSEKKFEIKKSNIKIEKFEGKKCYEDPKKNNYVYRTIEAFSSNFPDLGKYQIYQGINPLKIIGELKINEKLNYYFEMIKEKITEKDIKPNKYESLYKEKIEDYVMNKLYDKIYPLEPDESDSQVFKNCMNHSWIEPHHIEAKDYIYDVILPDILNEFQQIYISKTPLKKYKNLKKIIYYIKNIIIFNEGNGKEIAQDDIIPILNYAFIKAKPFRISTDLQLIKYFLDYEKEDDQDIQSFISLIGIIKKEYNAKYFHMTNDEYNEKCLNSYNKMIKKKN